MALDILLCAALIAGVAVGTFRGARRTWLWTTLAALGAVASLGVWWLQPPGMSAMTTGLAASVTGVVLILVGLLLARWLIRFERRELRIWSRVAGGGLGAVLGVCLVFVGLPGIAALQPNVIGSSLASAAYQPLMPARVSVGVSDTAAAGLNPETPAEAQTSKSDTKAEVPTRRLIAWTRVATINGQRSQSYTGTVRATDRAQLSFEATGDIAAILVKVGDTVKAGDVLAKLDDTPLKLAVAEREAGVAEARAVLEEARADFRRQKRLFDRKVIASARLERAQLSLSTAQSRLKSAEASRKTAEDSLSSAVLRAPFNARVSAQLREASEIAIAGNPVIEVEGLTSGRELVVNLPEDVVSRIDLGDTFQLDTKDDTATVTEIGSRARGAATFPVTLALQTSIPVMTGATRSVRVRYQTHTRTVTSVPLGAGAVGRDRTGRVFVYNDETQRVASRDVTIERYRRDAVVVSGDLAAGEIIASRGASFLNDDDPVDLMGVGVARFER
ncbi:MAG: efflux RND transporter periplasmic adaptor subunit [Pseudomonadota bacterium]